MSQFCGKFAGSITMSPSSQIERIAASAWSEASVSTINGESRSQCTRIGADVNACFSVSKDDWQSVAQDQGLFFYVSWVNRRTNSEYPLINHL